MDRRFKIQPLGHIVLSGVVGGGIYAYFNSFTCGLIAFCSGIAIDIDHIFDFHKNYGIKRYREFFVKLNANDLKKIYLFFHSFEMLIMLWIAIDMLKLNLYWISFATGVTFHIVFDHLFNGTKPLSYFLIYRAYHSFKKEKILKKQLL